MHSDKSRTPNDNPNQPTRRDDSTHKLHGKTTEERAQYFSPFRPLPKLLSPVDTSHPTTIAEPRTNIPADSDQNKPAKELKSIIRNSNTTNQKNKQVAFADSPTDSFQTVSDASLQNENLDLPSHLQKNFMDKYTNKWNLEEKPKFLEAIDKEIRSKWEKVKEEYHDEWKQEMINMCKQSKIEYTNQSLLFEWYKTGEEACYEKFKNSQTEEFLNSQKDEFIKGKLQQHADFIKAFDNNNP
jgi:hypothetical protein